jgi:hypothetical protein
MNTEIEIIQRDKEKTLTDSRRASSIWNVSVDLNTTFTERDSQSE